MPTIAYDARRDALYSPQDDETIFDDRVEYKIPAIAAEFARLAYVHAEDAGPQFDRLTQALARVRFGEPVLFGNPDTDTQGFGALRADDGLAIVSFRGTEPGKLTDIAVDLKASLTPWNESAGRVHDGFATATRSVLPGVTQWLEATKNGRRRLVLTGHSLGAAIATLAASVCRPNELVTIGSPRVGNADFVATLAGVAITRLVDCCDLVTELPPELGGYVHAGSMTFIDADGTLDPSPDPAFVQADREAARIAYLRAYAWKIGNVMIRDLADHAAMNYIRSLVP
ncbi:lipase family protein [Caballeronia sp. J97]|uniref:lipase family protein n=1 Tax=Caballeronia sp. J97 TaxID=2805429 RepID=UPI002AB033FB|nr:lipase family protein [Caballeronia sp. J97]